MSERLKRWFSVRVDWWFAYNALSARLVEALGFPKEKITPVMNSTDTVALRKKHLEIKSEGIDRVRAALGIGPGPVGLFLGRLYFNKRVDFTLRAAMEIRKRVPTFELIVIGDGEDRGMVVDAAARNSWIHYPGPKGDTEKVPYMAVADVLLNPGVVGLVINDAMAMGLPTLTTDFPTHSPEIDYLEDGVTGLISRPWQDLPPYVEMAVALLSEPDRLSIMKETSRAAGEAFSAETMAGNFAGGILPALESTLSKSP
jgi:glycosyltransferase involved in cell wall biosynthesis